MLQLKYILLSSNRTSFQKRQFKCNAQQNEMKNFDKNKWLITPLSNFVQIKKFGHFSTLNRKAPKFRHKKRFLFCIYYIYHGNYSNQWKNSNDFG